MHDKTRIIQRNKKPMKTDHKSKKFEEVIEQMIRLVGEDPSRDGLTKTPERVARMFSFLTQGYHQDIDEVLNDALFPIQYDEMVIVKDIDFYSLCEHHLVPFFGKCHVAYLPDRKIIGLSKLPRLVEVFSRRFQVQERLTQQIAETLQEKIKPQGVAVVMEAQHLCMMMRGVEKQNATAITSSMLGVFRTRRETRAEFLELIKRSRVQMGSQSCHDGDG